MQRRKWKRPGKGHKDDRNDSQNRMVITRVDKELFRLVYADARSKSQSLSFTIQEAVKEKYRPEAIKP